MIQDAYSSLCGLFLTHYQERLGQEWVRLVIFQTKLYPQDHPDPKAQTAIRHPGKRELAPHGVAADLSCEDAL